MFKRIEIAEPEAAAILARGPRLIGNGWHYTNCHWSDVDERNVAVLCAAGVDLEATANSLGRKPTTIAHHCRDRGFSIPPEWAAAITKRKAKIIDALMSFPYIKKARPEHADLMRANALVPPSLPEHMRADVCQSIMLALFEGNVTLYDLERNKKKTRWFIRKFYKDQRPWEEINLEGKPDDDRSYVDIAAARSRDALHRATEPGQEDAVFLLEARNAYILERKRNPVINAPWVLENLASGNELGYAPGLAVSKVLGVSQKKVSPWGEGRTRPVRTSPGDTPTPHPTPPETTSRDG